ncbi:hypothetical protein NW768_009733 [Fusarium equiseti]|uniref:Uncharacterized protein n=1 Tax=Fusarium equiseti TaxID=61235 RepID=A0ABQ8R1R3_FUSEQ|nr:hypothetical protein NW768_009733 [Fusarium equiseti]
MLKGPRAAKGFVFITADAHGQAAAGDRKLIRSHVMRGKNTRTRALPGPVKGRFPATAMGMQRPQHVAGDSDSSEEPHGARSRSELLNSDEDALARIRHAEMAPSAADMFTFIKFPEDIDGNAELFDSAFDSSSELAQLKPLDASCFSGSRSVVRTLKKRLYAIFKDVQDLSQLLNDSHDSGHRIREISLEDLITFIQSRLLMLEFEDNDIFSELLRLSLVAFLTTIFWGFPGVKFEYPHLANQLRQACMAFTPSTPGESYIFAWAMMHSINLYTYPEA